MAAGSLAGFRSARTRRAHGADLAAFATWCHPRGLDVLVARRVQVDLHTTGLLDAGGATSMATADAVTAEHGGWSAKSAVVHDYVRRDENWRRNPMRNVL